MTTSQLIQASYTLQNRLVADPSSEPIRSLVLLAAVTNRLVLAERLINELTTELDRQDASESPRRIW